MVLQVREKWLTVVYEPEPCCRALRVRRKFEPQIVGGAGERQILHWCAREGAQEVGGAVFAIVHLNRCEQQQKPTDASAP